VHLVAGVDCRRSGRLGGVCSSEHGNPSELLRGAVRDGGVGNSGTRCGDRVRNRGVHRARKCAARVEAVINGWQINTTGWVDGDGRNYLIAVLTDGNPTEAYGIDTVNAISAIVWPSLTP
jgi:hypothetical protein